MILGCHLRTPRRLLRFVGAERGSQVSQGDLYPTYVQMQYSEHASRGPRRVFERRHGLAEIVERGVGVLVEHRRVSPPHLAEQAKILVAEVEETNLDYKEKDARWARWHTCGLCEQGYHGVVRCALGWACWKTYLGRPETDQVLLMAWNQLGRGLNEAKHHEDALSVREAELSTLRRLGASKQEMLVVQGNLANTYDLIGRHEEALEKYRDVYSKKSELYGEEDRSTFLSAHNYAACMLGLQRFQGAKALLHKTTPTAQRVLGESHDLTLNMRLHYTRALYQHEGATLDDIREAATTLEETVRIARRVFGNAHPTAVTFGNSLLNAQAALRARETPSPGSH